MSGRPFRNDVRCQPGPVCRQDPSRHHRDTTSVSDELDAKSQALLGDVRLQHRQSCPLHVASAIPAVMSPTLPVVPTWTCEGDASADSIDLASIVERRRIDPWLQRVFADPCSCRQRLIQLIEQRPQLRPEDLRSLAEPTLLDERCVARSRRSSISRLVATWSRIISSQRTCSS